MRIMNMIILKIKIDEEVPDDCKQANYMPFF